MKIEIREISSIPTLMHWRLEVLGCVFGSEPSRRLLVQNRRYYRSHIPDGSHVAYVASADGADCGCGAICMYDELPSPDNPSGKCAYLMNIYVRGPYRNCGVGHAIVLRLIAEARSRGCGKIHLETTPQARRLYESLGFTEMHAILKL